MKKKINKEIDEWKNKYLRALADYQNLENRVRSQSDMVRQQANKELLIKLLDIFDDIEKAQLFINDSGLKLIREKFINLLKSQGISEIEVLNKPYDPYLAEVSEIVAGDTNNHVAEVVVKGYKLFDKIIRPARVKVVKKTSEQIPNSKQ